MVIVFFKKSLVFFLKKNYQKKKRMEAIWKWRQLSNEEKIQFANYIVCEIVEKLHITNTIKKLHLLCCLRFIIKENLIAQIFITPLSFFELDLLSKIKFVRFEIKDDENLEILGRLYEFNPPEIQCFLTQIIKKQFIINPKTLQECIHLIRCSYFCTNKNKQLLPFLLQQHSEDIKNNIDILIHYLVFDPLCFDFYTPKEYVLSFIFNHHIEKKQEKFTWQDYFEYDVHFVPAIPNELFLNQLFNSIDDICIDKKFIPLLLNHLFNLLDDNLLLIDSDINIGIISKMIIYHLSNQDEYLKCFLYKTQTKNGFIAFLVSKALGKEPDWESLKKYLINNAGNITQTILKTINNNLHLET